MFPFVMRDVGELRRQELLATSAYVELVNRLPAGGAKRSAASAWRKIAIAIRSFVQGQSSDRRHRRAVVWAGVQR